MSGSKAGPKSPVEEIEPVLLNFAAQRQEAGQPLKPSEGLELANSLIEGTPIQEKMKAFQTTIGKEATGNLSKKYWKNFMKRSQPFLESKKGTRLGASREEWTTYENLQAMYDLVYEQMIDVGVAK